ncbi:hypothetical protein K8R42_00180, partial [bacterium]|nr:hypothetical protein [bacterium]
MIGIFITINNKNIGLKNLFEKGPEKKWTNLSDRKSGMVLNILKTITEHTDIPLPDGMGAAEVSNLENSQLLDYAEKILSDDQ